MIEEIRKKKKRRSASSGGAPDYMVTYGDMMSLLLTFFIMLISAAKIEGQDIQLIIANFPGLGNLLGGESFNEGNLPYSGQIEQALPSKQLENAFDTLMFSAVQTFVSEVEKQNMFITFTERGLVISLASDIYFEKFSAEFNQEQGIETLRTLSVMLREFLSENLNVPIRVEGHTDESNFPVGLEYEDEWELSVARAVTILKILGGFSVPLHNAQVAGFGNTKRLIETDQVGSPFNRRVDIVILNEGNL